MAAEVLLSRLTKVRKTGPSKWSACCPAHDDQGPSLALRETEDGRTLIHCFAGCSAHDVVSATGLTLSDLMPPRPLVADRIKGQRRQFIPQDVFDVARMEIGVCAVIAADMLAGREINDCDYGRLWESYARLDDIARSAYA